MVDEVSSGHPQHGWTRPSQFTLAIVVLMVALFAGWVAIMFRQAEANRQAKSRLQEQSIRFAKSGYYTFTRNVSEPGMISGMFGDPGVQEIYWVRADSPRIDDEALTSLMVLLADVPHLETLDLRNTSVTDAGLMHIGKLKSLRILFLGYDRFVYMGENTSPDISDAGLAHLKGLTNLKELFIQQTKVTEEGIEKLKKALPDCQFKTGHKRQVRK